MWTYGRTWLARCGAVALGLATAGCGEVSRLVTPGDPAAVGPARIALTTAVHASTNAADIVSLQVLSEYARRGGSRARLGTFAYQLSQGATQAVPIPVDLATCLADVERDVESPKERVCPVFLTLALQVNGVVVDRQVIGPLRLVPGGTVGVAQPVSLFEITAIEVAEVGASTTAPGESFTVAMGGGTSLLATVRDRNAQIVRERAVTWSSEAPGVASVNASTGAITAVALGTTKVTASVGTLEKSVTVRVVRPPAGLTVEAGAGSGNGVVRSAPEGIDCRIVGTRATGACSATFPGDAQVTLTSMPEQGSVAPVWGGSCGDAAVSTCTLSMDQARVASARFTALRRLAIASDGDGRGRVVGDFGIDCRLDGTTANGSCTADVPQGAMLTLRAQAGDANSALQSFDRWGGDCSASTGDSCTVTVGQSAGSVVARFLDARRLTIAFTGTGSGQVVLADGAACSARSPAGCTREAAHGTAVTLRAVADSGSSFVAWGGACRDENSSTCLTTLDAARSVTADFTAMRRLQVVAAKGDGRGRVTGPGGLDCRIDGTSVTGVCSIDLADNASVTLVATPDQDLSSPQFFAGWGADCAGATGTACVVRVDGGGKRAVVTFREQPRLRVDVVGTGGGTVSASVVGIACVRAGGSTSGVCERGANFGATVLLVANPDANSVFGGWSGACSTFSGPTCTTTLVDAAQVSARFVAKRGTLTLAVTGAGAGAIEVNGLPACSAAVGQTPRTCAVQYDIGTTLQLRGVAATGAKFAGFSGDCPGSSPCILVMTPTRAATVRFDVAPPPPPPPQTATLTVQLTGTAPGGVTLGGQPFCALAAGQGSTNCTTTLKLGSVVQLAASAPVGSTVGTWGGGCSGSGTCQVTLSGNAQVSMSFAPVPVTVTFWLASTGIGGRVQSSIPGIDCSVSNGVTSGTCTMTVPYGSVVTFSALVPPKSRLEAWMGACSSATGSPACTLTLTGDVRIGAAFAKGP